MPTDTFYGTTADGHVRGGSNISWATARALTDGDSTRTDAYALAGYSSAIAGDEFLYTIARGFLKFDTSSLPDNAIITNVVLNIKPSLEKYDNGPGTATLCVTTATPANSPPALADFDQVGATHLTDSGQRPTYTGLTLESYVGLTLNSAGRTTINKAGDTWLALRTSHDIDDSVPAATNKVGTLIASADTTGTGSDPYLSITYVVPMGITAAIETDVASAFSLSKTIGIASASTTESAQALVVTKPIVKTLVSATEADQAIVIYNSLIIDPAVTTDVAQILDVILATVWGETNIVDNGVILSGEDTLSEPITHIETGFIDGAESLSSIDTFHYVFFINMETQIQSVSKISRIKRGTDQKKRHLLKT